MKPAVVLLGFILLLDVTFAAEESCVSRCGSFDPRRKCQCDSKCVYYGSCCGDYDTICPKKARGDTFAEEDSTEAPTTVVPTYNTIPVTTAVYPPPTTIHGPTPPVDRDAAPCSGQPFDAFLQLKNGSVYAFRGEYFFELDDEAVLPGYPKLIQDVWGISGPIDAAFTRINCQGKTYIFKGNKYWRFEGDVMDEDYPRDISVGFDGIPNDINAAFAVPAPSYRGKEKAYFFKGDKYYQYEFKHQPSHEQCVSMSRSSPSVLFSRYTALFCDQTLEDFLMDLFGDSHSSDHTGAHLISRDWVGIRPPVDAAIVGRVYMSPKPTQAAPLQTKRRGRRRKRPSKKRGRKGRGKRFLFGLWGYDDWSDYFDYNDYSDYSDYSDTTLVTTTPETKSTPVQNVYFFKRDKYYRVDLQTKRVGSVKPAYPRSIAKYWLGCKHEETPDASQAEKR